jgi:tetratricopeptide (TPR) repeat protein
VRSPVAVATTAGGTADGASHAATAEAAVAAGDWAAAEPSYDRALLRDPTNLSHLIGRAEVRLVRGDLAGARADLEAVLALEPNEAVAFRERAALRLRFGDATGAEGDYTQALALDPGDAAAMAGRGEALVAMAAGDRLLYDRAMADFTRAVALGPALVLARLGPALVFADRAEFGGDPADWQRAAAELDALRGTPVESEPRFASLEARVLLALGRAEEAGTRLASALETTSTGVELGRLRAAEAEVALAANRWDEAAAAAAGAVAADPMSWDGRRARTRAELGRAEFDAALTAAEELLRLLPGDGRTLYLQGLALAALGRAEAAREVLEAAGTRLAASPVYRARIAVAIDALDDPKTTGLAGPSLNLRRRAVETPPSVSRRFGR